MNDRQKLYCDVFVAAITNNVSIDGAAKAAKKALDGYDAIKASEMTGCVPVYRLQGNGDHFYTTSETERDNAISQYGYHSEGIAFYVRTEP